MNAESRPAKAAPEVIAATNAIVTRPRTLTVDVDDVDAIARALSWHLTPTRLDDLARRLVRECASRDRTNGCTR